MNLRFFLACLSMTAMTGPATAQQAPIQWSLTTLRGFVIGKTCEGQESAYARLRQDGFNAPPVRFTCHYRAPDFFHTDVLLHEQDGKQELIELFYAADSSLWRARVTLSWEGRYALSPKPTPVQVEASLGKRFGPPYLTGGGVQEVHEHTKTFAWGFKSQPSTMGQKAADAALGWMRSIGDLEGIVTQATLSWSDSTPRQSLVVEMTDRRMISAAVRAQQAAQQAQAAEQAWRNASMLEGL